MNWRKCLSMGIAAALVICLSNLDMVQAAEGEDAKSATAYLYFTDGWYSADVNYHKPGGDGTTKTIGTDATITGDGLYHLALDFAKTPNQGSSLNFKICIVDGDRIFGSDSIITIQKVVVNGTEQTSMQDGFTSGEERWEDNEAKKDTVFYLFDQQAAEHIDNVKKGDRVEGAQREAKDLNPFPVLGITPDLKTIEVDFSFSVNGSSVPSMTPDPNKTPDPSVSSDPNKTPDPSVSSDPNKTPDPSVSSDPNKTPDPSVSSDPNKTPDPSVSSDPNKTPDPSVSSDPNTTPDPGESSGPNTTPDPSGSFDPNVTPNPSESSNPGTTSNPNQPGTLVSNSTYTGAEKIIVQNNSVVIPAGGSSTVAFALLRSAASSTQVSVSSGNTGVASPVLQDNGKVRITVPAAAAAGSSTTVILRFGSSSASIKVAVRNAVSKVKAAKKSYKVKRKKKTKVVFQITAQNKSKTTTDEPVVKLSGKKATVSSIKLSGSKLTVTVKGTKKGSATLKATIGGKTAKTKLKIK